MKNSVLHHIYLVCPGATAQQVTDFYQTALGLVPFPKPQSLAEVPVLWFDGGTAKFHIGYGSEGSVGSAHTAIVMEDLTAARARFAELGYQVDNSAIPMGYDRFYVRDPWGNQFEILPPGLP